jgi:hypothetical protein
MAVFLMNSSFADFWMGFESWVGGKLIEVSVVWNPRALFTDSGNQIESRTVDDFSQAFIDTSAERNDPEIFFQTLELSSFL